MDIETLRVKLEADASQYNRVMDEAVRHLRAAAQEMKRNAAEVKAATGENLRDSARAVQDNIRLIRQQQREVNEISRNRFISSGVSGWQEQQRQVVNENRRIAESEIQNQRLVQRAYQDSIRERTRGNAARAAADQAFATQEVTRLKQIQKQSLDAIRQHDREVDALQAQSRQRRQRFLSDVGGYDTLTGRRSDRLGGLQEREENRQRAARVARQRALTNDAISNSRGLYRRLDAASRARLAVDPNARPPRVINATMEEALADARRRGRRNQTRRQAEQARQRRQRGGYQGQRGYFGIGGRVGGAFIGGAIPIPGGPVGAAIGAGLGFAVSMAEKLFSVLQGVADVGARIVSNAINLGLEYEKSLITFEVLTGGQAAGNKMVQDIENLALRTPYRSKQLEPLAQQLLGAGVEQESIIPVLSRLGTIAGGDSDRMRLLVKAYGDTIAAGRFLGQERRQFTNQGIGPEAFAATMGISVPEFLARQEQSQIGPNVVTATINRLTNRRQGGDTGPNFFGLNTRVNDSVGGQLNALLERIENIQRKGALKLFEGLNVSGWLDKMTTFLDSIDSGKIQQWVDGFKSALEPLEALALSVFDMVGGAVSDLFGKTTWEDAKSGVEGFSQFAVQVFADIIAGMKEALQTLREMNATWKDIASVYSGLKTVGSAAVNNPFSLFGLGKLAFGHTMTGFSDPPGTGHAAGAGGEQQGGPADLFRKNLAFIRNMQAGKRVAKQPQDEPEIPIVTTLSPQASAFAASIKKQMQEGAGVRKFLNEYGLLQQAFLGVNEKGEPVKKGPDLNAAQRQFGVRGLVKQLTDGFGNAPPALPTAAFRGTQEAADAIARDVENRKAANPIFDVVRILEEQLKIEEQEKAALDKMAESLDAYLRRNPQLLQKQFD
jgi:hypothetical protein